jgi:energy-coupling factor transporter transmembrane protein EcfT
MQSFVKDIVLFVLILIICFGLKYIRPIFNGLPSFLMVFLLTLLILGFQWYVLKHQPVVDCLPFKKGNNLLELRKMPADAIPDKVDFKFVYEKEGNKKVFDKTQLPDSTWSFLKREDVIIEKGKNNEPPIKDFFITTLSGTDTTEALLNYPDYYYLFFIKDFNAGTDYWLNNFSALYTYAKNKNRQIYIVASQATAAQDFFNIRNNFNLPVFSCDVTALKTAARTNPALYLMHGAVVEDKWGWADFGKAMK